MTGEPGFSVNCGKNALEIYRNACTEVTSKSTNDICNLGSINLARVDTIEQFENLVELGTIYLLAGSVYSDVPYSEVDQVRSKNRRLGLGLMGVHEWLLKRGKPYAPDHELWQWLKVYQKSTKIAHEWADEFEISPPVKTRAIAPTGTISIVAETTSGIEPIFCKAYKRRYLKGSVWHYQYVVDPTANRLIKSGISPELIEDAYDLSWDVERRVEFQSWMQQAVDHGISSTVNLPHWGSEQNNEANVRSFGEMLLKYLPKLRGITCYPDGARGGQPLTPVSYKEAIKHTGEELVEEATDVCDITKGGTCGD
jgi:ribonucleoside-diphosphate reductase alpha chain